jgi:hypothetical protein
MKHEESILCASNIVRHVQISLLMLVSLALYAYIYVQLPPEAVNQGRECPVYILTHACACASVCVVGERVCGGPEALALTSRYSLKGH